MWNKFVLDHSRAVPKLQAGRRPPPARMTLAAALPSLAAAVYLAVGNIAVHASLPRGVYL
jgi:hypothetical protein